MTDKLTIAAQEASKQADEIMGWLGKGECSSAPRPSYSELEGVIAALRSENRSLRGNTNKS